MPLPHAPTWFRQKPTFLMLWQPSNHLNPFKLTWPNVGDDFVCFGPVALIVEETLPIGQLHPRAKAAYIGIVGGTETSF